MTKRIKFCLVIIVSLVISKLKLADIAHAAHTSERTLVRHFPAETNMTIFEFIHQTRIKHACNKLSSGDKTITEAAFESGFGSIQQFNRVFKKVKKCTPTEWLKKI